MLTLFPSITSPGRFALSGSPNTPVYFSFSQNNFLYSGGNKITFTNVISNSLSPITLNSSGTATIDVGGDILYSAGQVAGTYSGTYTITANY